MDKRAFWNCLGAHIWLKAIGSTLSITLFFVAYFAVLNHPVFPVRTMPVLVLDRIIPIWPSSVWLYFSLWLYVCLPAAIMDSRALLVRYLSGSILLAGMGLAVFLLIPTAVPDWAVDWSPYPVLAFLKESDASGNACPSLHVGFAVFSGLWLASRLKNLQASRPWQVFNLVWCVAIVLSTMTTRQHVLVDVLCGAFLGTVVGILNMRYPTNETVAPTSVPVR